MKFQNLKCQGFKSGGWVVISIFFVVFYMQSAAQKDSLRQHYLQKSKNQKAVAWVLLAGGVTMYIIGTAASVSNIMSFDDQDSGNKNAGAVVAIAGTACILGCIPLVICARSNEKKANLTISVNRVQRPMSNSIASIAQPCLKLIIPL